MKQQKALWTWLAVIVLAFSLVAVGAPMLPAAEQEEPDQSKSLAPYVPTPMEVVEEMLKLADVKSTDVVFDLGCGDGRIVVMAAKKHGARGVGVDFDPVRVREAKELAKKEGVEKKVNIIQHDAMTVDFSSATVVTLYLLPDSNAKLRPRLERLLRVGSRVVSHDFDMPVWQAEKTKEFADKSSRQHTLYLWKITPEMKERAKRPEAKEGEKVLVNP